ncbi:U3 small nucleolar RNA-associated protein 18 homolog isoform X1 [Vicugna pacos]|uniref:U3 small nucleolar RNA-associated protein 18 homolog isoform X1 n=1 Tax=Vicugna pacos TaxID=30538 RepID=A0ABM5BJZ0_VICPA
MAVAAAAEERRVQVQADSGDSEVENEAKDDFPPQKKPVWLDEEDEDEEMVDMMNNRLQKDMMKNTAESKLSKDELQKRLKEEFHHAMGGVPAWAETNRWKTSSDVLFFCRRRTANTLTLNVLPLLGSRLCSTTPVHRL